MSYYPRYIIIFCAINRTLLTTSKNRGKLVKMGKKLHSDIYKINDYYIIFFEIKMVFTNHDMLNLIDKVEIGNVERIYVSFEF